MEGGRWVGRYEYHLGAMLLGGELHSIPKGPGDNQVALIESRLNPEEDQKLLTKEQ
jgi:hypothetical protein